MGTNAVAVKKELFARLQAAVDDRLAGVQVSYMLCNPIGQEVIYGGDIHTEVVRATMSETSDREETATIDLHIRLFKPGAVDSDVETRAAEIGAAIADLIAADPTLDGLPKLFDLTVTGEDYKCGTVDDGQSAAIGTVRVTAQSFLDD